MKHYLIFKDDKSDKFWQIEVSGKSFTVTYGKTGSTGTSQTKTLADEKQCLQAVEKLLAEKKKKGYIKGDSREEKLHYLKEWQAITAANDLHQALVSHFSFLADSPDFQPVLAAVMKRAESVHVKEQKLTIQFKGKVVMEAIAPAGNIPKRYPVTYRKVLQKHEKISINADIVLGDHGLFEPEWLEEVESELLEITDPEKIISPLWYGSDCWVYHPKKKNAFGEPVLYFLSHEGGDVGRPQPYNVGSFFLSKLADGLKLKVELPVTLEKVAKNTGEATENWEKKIEVLYDGVNRYGKNEEKPFPEGNKLIELLPKIKSLRFENLSTMKAIPFEKMVALEELNVFCPLYGKKIPLMSLEGIEKASGLTKLQLFGHQLTDISRLAPLHRLVRIDLACNKIKDISILKNFLQLEEIQIKNNPVSDITPLTILPKLKTLSIQSTNVKDVNCLIQLKSLKYLTLPELDKSQIDAFKMARPDVKTL